MLATLEILHTERRPELTINPNTEGHTLPSLQSSSIGVRPTASPSHQQQKIKLLSDNF